MGRPDFGSTAMSVAHSSCGSYGPGHQMHWIQAKKSHEDDQPVVKVTVVGVHDDGRVEIEGVDLKLTLWYHDLGHLRSALGFGGRAEWKPRYHVLNVISSGSFNLATLDKQEPCKPPIRRRPTETTPGVHRTGAAREPRLHGSGALAACPGCHTGRRHRRTGVWIPGRDRNSNGSSNAVEAIALNTTDEDTPQTCPRNRAMVCTTTCCPMTQWPR